jgi:hypothetical protein
VYPGGLSGSAMLARVLANPCHMNWARLPRSPARFPASPSGSTLPHGSDISILAVDAPYHTGGGCLELRQLLRNPVLVPESMFSKDFNIVVEHCGMYSGRRCWC